MDNFARWKTVKEIKEILNEYDDNYTVFIEPHKYLTDYPFYVYSHGNNVIFRLYDESLLPEPLKMKINDFIWKIKIKWWNKKWNLVNFRKKQ